MADAIPLQVFQKKVLDLSVSTLHTLYFRAELLGLGRYSDLGCRVFFPYLGRKCFSQWTGDEQVMALSRIFHFEVLAFLYALGATVCYQILNGRINLTGAFSQKGAAGQVSPGRIQLLVSTIAASATYLTQVGNATNGKMPDFDVKWLYVIGGSSGIYALEKAWAAWNARRNS